MKKFFTAMCLTLALCFTSIPVFAADTSEVSSEIKTVEETSARAQQGLLYRENLWFMGIQQFTVTPSAGTTLNVWLKNDNPVKMTVYYTNAGGGYSTAYSTRSFAAGERDVTVAQNCNGKKYLIKFESAIDGSTISFLAYQR